MSKRYTYLIFLLLLCVCARGNVSFSHKLERTGANHLTLTFTGEVPKGYHVDANINFEEADGIFMDGDLQKEGEGKYVQRLRTTQGANLIKGYFKYMVCDDVMCYSPKTVEFSYQGKAAGGGKDGTESTIVWQVQESKVTAKDSPHNENEKITDGSKLLEDSLWQPVVKDMKALGGSDDSHLYDLDERTKEGLIDVIVLGFIGGLLALFTPCVWPIIPLTVSIFLKRRRTVKNAFAFGSSIVVLFVAMGFIVTLLFGSNAMNTVSTSATFNLICFITLLFLGLSLLGLFEIRLPSHWSNSLDEIADGRSGLVNIVCMALTLVIVSFSCTAPIIGLLLVEVSSQGNHLAPLLGMTSFAVALALPFTFFALFPRWMWRLPKSGQWMMHAKIALAALEIAFSLKYFSVADQTHGWGILSPTGFLVAWSIIAGGFTIYLFLKSTSRMGKISTIPFLLLTIYLVQGIFTHHTSYISAFLPIDLSRYDSKELYFRNYNEGMMRAQELKKPVFIDFTGFGCVNCRKMEGAVFAEERVKQILDHDFVVIELFVDDRTRLKENILMYAGDRLLTLRTVGDLWSMLEQHKFGSQSQPFYVILSPDGKAISPAYGYNEDIEKFLEFLDNRKKYKEGGRYGEQRLHDASNQGGS